VQALLRVLKPDWYALDVEGDIDSELTLEQVAAIPDGIKRVVYSSPYYWQKIMHNTGIFVPHTSTYWEANYLAKFRVEARSKWRWNGAWPTLQDNPWTPQTKGWPDGGSRIWQFSGTAELEGVNVDLNVYDPEWWS